MDCIQMYPVKPARDWAQQDADRARSRMHRRTVRLAHDAEQEKARLEAQAVTKAQGTPLAADTPGPNIQKKSVIAAALARARQRRAHTGDSNG